MGRLLTATLSILLLLGSSSASAQIPIVGFDDAASGYGSGVGYSTLGDPAQQIDQFWRDVFGSAGLGYRPPYRLVALDGPMETRCGLKAPRDQFFYCSGDESIYMAPVAIDQVAREHGDYAPITILAHEWAHHVQFQLGVPRSNDNRHELQADCLAGAWTQEAQRLGLLDKGDVTEAANLSADSGDDYLDSQNVPDAHGINDDRIAAFMRGYDDGIADCDLPLTISSAQVVQSPTEVPMPARTQAPISPPVQPTYLSAAQILPAWPAVSNANCFVMSARGFYDYAAVASFAAGTALPMAWRDGGYVDFNCGQPVPGGARFVEAVVHTWADPASAAQAAAFWQSAAPSVANEARLCDSRGTVMVCGIAVGVQSAPAGEALAMLQQALAAVP